jgi:ABC-type Fe3+/spermidine/putrescine transport system ATPase subunit
MAPVVAGGAGPVTEWTMRGVTARLDGFTLGPVDLDLHPGEVVAVLGPSGAGKTTLLRTLAGFVRVRAGQVVRGAEDITDAPPERRGLGYVPQGLGLLPHRTVESNVGYALEVRGRRDTKVRARAMLERFGLTPLARRYPARLSGGEAQRVALARALVAEPELILWDEPWQALDVEARHALGLVFEELREQANVPVLVVTHDPGLAFSVADRFLVLRGGRVALRADAAQLIDRPTDAFTARFVGFENVYGPDELGRGGSGSLAAWLAARAGPEGVAVPRPDVRGDGPWVGVVRGARPTPEGLALTVRVDHLNVALRAPPGSAPLPGAGDRVRFAVEEKTLRPLGEAAS